MSGISLNDSLYKNYKGEVEIIIKDINGNVIDHQVMPNIVKIFAKEVLSHRIAHNKVWDQNAGTGEGAWVTHNIDIEEFAVKYIVFGASFDEQGNPLDSTDSRFYVTDTATGGSIPITLYPGADYDGGMINPIPISEPTRPLKRIERIYWEPSYQPAGTPLLQSDVRALNNVVVFETTLQKEEYNGFGNTVSDFFTLTEVALVGAAEVGATGACECDPRDIFLTGNPDGTANSLPQAAMANSTATINLDISEPLVDLIKEGDQIKIVDLSSTAAEDNILNQINPYYLVVNKAIGGRDITLDRVPVDVDNNTITGQIGLLRDGFKIFSHRILKTPVKKSSDFQIVVRWRIIFN